MGRCRPRLSELPHYLGRAHRYEVYAGDTGGDGLCRVCGQYGAMSFKQYVWRVLHCYWLGRQVLIILGKPGAFDRFGR